jgi:peroxiredoxin
MNILLESNLSSSGRAVIAFLAIALLSLLAAVACTPSAQDIGGGQPRSELPPAPKAGRLAPDFTLTDLDGNQVKLSDFRGKTVFLNFWATWCPPCRAEMPEIESIHQEYKDKNVVVIGIALSEPENEVRQFIQRSGYSWTFLIDTRGEASSNYEVTAIPTSFFLDRERIIRAVNIGAMSERSMEAKLAEAMK